MTREQYEKLKEYIRACARAAAIISDRNDEKEFRIEQELDKLMFSESEKK